MWVVDAIQNFTSSVWNLFWSFISRITSFFQSVLDVLTYIGWIFKALWFWLTSLLSWIWDLIQQVFNWSVFHNVANGLIYVSDYIWAPATIFIASLLLIVIFRIIIAFVFKIFRMRMDYDKKYFHYK